MSQFSGQQFKGAMAARRKDKKAEAASRNATSNARMQRCGHVHGEEILCTNPAVSA